MSLIDWALPRISKILPLDDESLNQIISFSERLSKEAAAEHLKELLGDSPQALEFITSFNARRSGVTAENTKDEGESKVPRHTPKPRKKKEPLNKLPPPRQPDNYGDVSGAYKKQDEQDYVSAKPKDFQKADPPSQNTPVEPEALQATHSEYRPTSRLPPSASGHLISDEGRLKTESPRVKTKAKVSITGGTAMRGQSQALNDLDAAIRDLEIQTNPTMNESFQDPRRRCNCMAQRHALLTAFPNCLNCGKIICVKEGLGPCTFCDKPLLSQSELQSMIRILRDERGKERMEEKNAANKRADISTTPRPFSTPRSLTPVNSSAPSSDSESERKLAAAKEHRDRLLKFQAENARRTRIHDEASDFETPDAGLNMWASPQERALQLKKQQKVLREQQWNARPDYEKRQMVVSIDLSTGKAVKQMAKVERPEDPGSDDEMVPQHHPEPEPDDSDGGGFTRNPLRGILIKPTYRHAKGDSEQSGTEIRPQERPWRVVQDDDDNEQWILDGGAYGYDRPMQADEPAC